MRANKLICAAVAGLALVTGFARAEDLLRTIRVTGEGIAAAPPDMATVQSGVVTQAVTAKEALAANNKAMANILAILKQHDIDPKYVQTSQFSVRPIHKRDDEGRTLPNIVAYDVANQVRVQVRQLPNLGHVLDALIQAGSNQVSGINFGIADSTAVLDEARKKAIADARHRAQLYAQEAGARLGKIQTISEQPIQLPQPRFLGRRDAFEAKAAVPIAIGEEEFRVTVYAVFALKDRGRAGPADSANPR